MGNQNWHTPKWFYKVLEDLMVHETGHVFQLDAASTDENPLGTYEYYTPADNGLIMPWRNATFWNPPWKQFAWWVNKADREAENDGVHSCGVGPAGSNQKWFHETARKWRCYAPTMRIQYLDPDTGDAPGKAYSNTMAYFIGPKFRNMSPERFDLRPLLIG